jgi:hypothetical protein
MPVTGHTGKKNHLSFYSNIYSPLPTEISLTQNSSLDSLLLPVITTKMLLKNKLTATKVLKTIIVSNLTIPRMSLKTLKLETTLSLLKMLILSVSLQRI